MQYAIAPTPAGVRPMLQVISGREHVWPVAYFWVALGLTFTAERQRDASTSQP